MRMQELREKAHNIYGEKFMELNHIRSYKDGFMTGLEFAWNEIEKEKEEIKATETNSKAQCYTDAKGTHYTDDEENEIPLTGYARPYVCDTRQTPHTCPVCAGRGTVPNGFYSGVNLYDSTSIIPEQCRSCIGTGVLWG